MYRHHRKPIVKYGRCYILQYVYKPGIAIYMYSYMKLIQRQQVRTNSKLCDGTVPSLEFVPVDIESVSSTICSLHVQKASGADGLPTWFVRASPYMARLVTVLINKCIESSSVPFQWKQAIVTPVPKCKHCTSLSNFRPISVLPVLSKVLERVLHNQIQLHLIKYDLLCPHQSGFRTGYSTQDVVLHVTDKWLKAIDEDKYTGAVFLDLAKAFDTVDHSILCTKLTQLLWLSRAIL